MKKKIVKKVAPGETDFKVNKGTGLWEPISIYFSDKTKKSMLGSLCTVKQK